MMQYFKIDQNTVLEFDVETGYSVMAKLDALASDKVSYLKRLDDIEVLKADPSCELYFEGEIADINWQLNRIATIEAVQ